MIVPVDSAKFAVLRTSRQEWQETVLDNLGAGQISLRSLDRVKVPTGGATMWTVPGVNGEEAVKEIVGIIVNWQSPRAYYSKPFTGAGEAPDCYSDDGATGNGKPGGECASCPKNQWGEKGEPKQCSERRTLFVLREVDILPIIVNVPTTSIRNVTDYFTRLLARNCPYWSVVTALRLEKAKSESGITYAKIVPSLVAALSPEQRELIRDYAASLKPSLTRARGSVQPTEETPTEEAFPTTPPQ